MGVFKMSTILLFVMMRVLIFSHLASVLHAQSVLVIDLKRNKTNDIKKNKKGAIVFYYGTECFWYGHWRLDMAKISCKGIKSIDKQERSKTVMLFCTRKERG